MDYLGQLLLIPREIVNRAYMIFFSSIPPYFWEALCWTGLDKRCVTLTLNDYITAFYCVSWVCPFRGLNAPIVMLALRNFVKGRVGLDISSPSRYGFATRPQSRRITNMDEIVNLAKQKYRNISWEMLEETSHPFLNAANFNQLKFFFSPHGSGIVHALYMQPRTVVCEVEAERGTDWLQLIRLLGLYHILSRIKAMIHFGGHGAPLPLKIAEEMIEIAIACLNQSIRD
jgi:hypothetical protein